MPDGADGVDDVFCGEAIAFGDFGITGTAAAEAFAFFEEVGACGAVDGSVHSATPEEAGVGGIDDGVELESGDV